MTEDKHSRRSRRSLVLLVAKVKTPNGIVEARLRNLSQNGALLEADAAPAAGVEVVFERGQTIVEGRIAWSSNGRFGIEFHDPIEESEVLVHVGRPKAKVPEQPVFRRSGFRETNLSVGERKIGEAWAKPVGRTLGE